MDNATLVEFAITKLSGALGEGRLAVAPLARALSIVGADRVESITLAREAVAMKLGETALHSYEYRQLVEVAAGTGQMQLVDMAIARIASGLLEKGAIGYEVGSLASTLERL